MYNVKGVKSVGLINVNDQNGITFAAAFIKAYEALGGKILAHETNESSAVDMRTQLLKINATKPEALVVFSNIPENAYTVAQAREMGMTRPIFSNTFIIDPETFKVAGSALNGVMGVTMRFDPNRSPAAKSFSEKFKARSGRDPSISEALAYDGVKLVAEAMSKVGNDPKAIRDYIVSVKDWPGVSTTFNFDENGILKVNLTPFEIADGKVTFPAK
jgi:branched-chain amino acid transport system substrate-binding protein